MKNMKKIIAVLMSLTAITMTTSAFAAGNGTATYDADAKAVPLDSKDLASATGQLTVVIVPVDAGKEGHDPITSGNIYYINQAEAGDGEGKFNSIIDAMKVKDEFVFENEKYEVRIGGEGFDEYLSYIITGEELEKIIYGDANGDKEVLADDAARILQYRAGMDVQIDIAAADANGDDEVLADDAARILQYRAGMDVTLGK